MTLASPPLCGMLLGPPSRNGSKSAEMAHDSNRCHGGLAIVAVS
jgi:hypothetical protein